MLKSSRKITGLFILACFIFSLNMPTAAQAAAFFQSNAISISGQVTDLNGIGVSGVTVRAVLDNYEVFIPQVKTASNGATRPARAKFPSAGTNFYTVITDASGYYTLTELPPGRYKISAHKDGLDFAPLSYTVSKSTTLGYHNFTVDVIPTVYTPITTVLTETTTSELVSISEDQSRFTFAAETAELAQVDSGDIIISGISPLAPEGFLRRVVSEENQGSHVILVTEPANLEDAFESLSVSTTQELTLADLQEFTQTPGVQLLRTPSLMDAGGFQFAMNNAVLYDLDGNLATTGDQVTANGLLSILPQFELRLRIENASLKEFYFSSTLNGSVEFTVSSQISATINSPSPKILPKPISLGVIPVGPLVLTPELDIVSGISGSVSAGISTTITNTTSFTAGAWILDGNTTNLSSFSNNFSCSPLSFDVKLSFSAFIGPEISIKLYGIAGVYVQAAFSLTLDISPIADPWLTLSAGLEVAIGLKASIPLGFFEIDLIDVKIGAISTPPWVIFSLYRTANNQPYPPSAPVPVNNAANQSLATQLSWTGSDPDADDPLVYDVYFGPGRLAPTVKVSDHQSAAVFDPGILPAGNTFSWKIVAFDSQGLSTGGPIWQFSTLSGIPLPAGFEKVSPLNGVIRQPGKLTLDWQDSAGAASYAFCYDPTNDNVCSPWVSTGSVSQATVDGLRPDTTYYWQARAVNISGSTDAGGSPAGFWRFTTTGEMVAIPAGEFQMGCDPEHNGGSLCNFTELPLHAVVLDAYRIDKFEVTNAQYALCVAEGYCAAPASISSLTRPGYYNQPSYANYPVLFVSWQDATNYCAWADKRLPTEAEWENAARGSALIAYPWGDLSPSCQLANSSDESGGTACLGDTSSVGSDPLGASSYGALDMAGNAAEWVNDWSQTDYYKVSPLSNPPGPAAGTHKMLRGGSFNSVHATIRTAARDKDLPAAQSSSIGFRCAAPAP
jgi:formylglycine-generating enzyme required for sulfatase activity